MFAPQPSDIMPPVKASNDDHSAEVMALLQLVTFGDNNETRAEPDVWRRIAVLAKKINGHVPQGWCKSCKLALIDVLRSHVGLGPARRPADESLKSRRLEVCNTCPAHHQSTNSCGTLILGAFRKETMEIRGRLVTPCGCYLPAKAAFKSENCPGNFWPNR